MKMKELRFDILPGLNCNFRCKYCYEKGQYENTKWEIETIRKTIDFIVNAYNLLKSDEELQLHLFFWGGEPLLYIDEIYYLVKAVRRKLPDIRIISNVTTNGYLIKDNLHRLKDIDKVSDLRVNVSYDYYMQDMTRMPNTYQIIRDNITLLFENNILARTITTFTAQNLKYFYETIKDYYDFISNPTNINKFQYNIDYDCAYNDTDIKFDEKAFISSLKKARKYVIDNNLNADMIRNNTHCSKREGFSRNVLVQKIVNNDMEELYNIYDGAFFGGVFCCIDYQGIIRTGMASFFSPNRNDFILGTLNDSPETIIQSYRNLVDKTYNKNIINDISKCVDCQNDCKLNYLRTIKNNDITTLHSMPNPIWCRIHDLLVEYKMCRNKDISFMLPHQASD